MEHSAKIKCQRNTRKANGSFFGRKRRSAFFSSSFIQPKLAIGAADDPYEREADATADKVMRINDANTWHTNISPVNVQRKCAGCEEEDKKVQMKGESSTGAPMTAPSSVDHVVNSAGQPLDAGTRTFMESRFGYDFAGVRVHNDSSAHRSSAEINALAYTHGNHIVFGDGQYQPGNDNGKKLLAHELSHVVQQKKGASNLLQKKDLKSPRLAGNTIFENVLDNKDVLEYGDTGPEVRRIQQLLVDLGILLPAIGMDGIYKTETMIAVKKFQKKNKLDDDGRVGYKTIEAFDRVFAVFTLPADKSKDWSMACILSILCPWNKHMVEKILPGYTIITFDSREYPVERWDGTKWTTEKISVGGFRNPSKNMGFLNTVTCEEMAFIIYHEGWHATEPTKMTGKVERETNAYVAGEQWSIDVGVPGRADFENKVTKKTESFRSTTGGTTEVDEKAAETFVKQDYGGVSVNPGEVVVERDGATNVKVEKPDGSVYIRAANKGESILGSPVTVNEKKIDPKDWVCP